MFKSRLFFIILAIIFSIYWFVLFPLLWVYLKPVIIETGILDSKPKFWIPSIFWCSALIVFVILLMILWLCMCCLRKKDTKTLDIGNAHLDSSTIHNADNKNVKDRIQLNELKLKCKSDADAYQDIQDVFLRSNKDKVKLNTATQTSQISDTCGDIMSTASSPKDFDALRSSRRLSSCYSCSKSITDDDMVNIFLNKLWTDDNDTNDVKFEVVGKSVNQAKRIQIDENITEISDDSTSTIQPYEKSSDIISIPVRQSSRLKSEIFIIINEDSTLQVVNGSDDVFK